MASESSTRPETHHDTHDTQTNSFHFGFTPSQQDNPYFLQSSDSPGMKLVSEPFDGAGFSNWKRSMTIALSARNKLGFVDGSITKPAVDSVSFKSWSRCNDMVISWILGALSKSIGRSVIYSNSAHQMWLELEERYGTSNGAQLFGLHKDLNQLSQGNLNISDYFTKLKMLWDDIESLCLVPACSCGCKCGSAQKLSKFQHDQKVIQFLMGLNDTYAVMRGSILMTSPLPNISQVYNILLQEESQREIHSGTQFLSDSASLAVNSSRFQSTQFNAFKKGVSDSRKPNLHCNYCKKPGHLIEKCYKLHGYPADFKFTKGKRVVAQVEVSGNNTPTINQGASSSDTKSPSPTTFGGISPELCSQLVNLIKSAQVSDSSPSYANFAGLFSEDATGSW